MIIPAVLLGLLFFTAIFFGGPHVWVQTLFIIFLFLFVLAVLWQQTFKNSQNKGLPISIIREPVVVIGLLFLVWTAFSLLPLPTPFLKVLSPKTYQIWETTSLTGGKFPHPLSLYPYMTRNSWTFGLALFLFYGLVLYGIRLPRQIHWLMIGILTLGILESIYALFQLAAAQPYILWWRKTVYENVATGTFINQNHLADFLALIICFGVGYLWVLGKEHSAKGFPVSKSRMYRLRLNIGTLGAPGLVLLLTLSLMIAALLASASRGGALALMTGLLFMGGLLISRFSKSRQAVVLLISLSLVCSLVGYAALERVLERFQRFELDFGDRLVLFKDSFQMARDFPLTGSGLGTFEFVFPGYQGSLIKGLVDYAHNDWIQLFAETGIVGLIILGGGFLWFMGHSINLWRKSQDPLSIGLGLGGLGALMAVAVHSLMDFSLHIPANALLVALITAITSLSLRIPRIGEKEGLSPVRSTRRISLGAVIPLLALFSLLTGVTGLRTFQIWRADSLARTVWNSTIPFQDPSDSDLIKAWTLAPGNARYWAWMASRLSQKPEKSLLIEEAAKDGKGRDDIYFLGQGILRNPTAWDLWRDLSRAAFLKAGKEPAAYFPLAERASRQVCQLRPFHFEGYFDAGLIGLASYARQEGKTNKRQWMGAFNQALSLNPDLSPLVADQMRLYRGPQGAEEMKQFLPHEARAYLLTGEHWLKQGFFAEGLKYLEQGESLREKKIQILWGEMARDGTGSPVKRQKALEQITLLDPRNPRALLLQGKVLEALKYQDRRGKVLGKLADPKKMTQSLRISEEQNQGPVAETAYFLGRLAEEEGDLQQAGDQFRRSLQSNPQFFPAWVSLERVLRQTQRSEGDRTALENLRRKIGFFEMAEVVGDAWIREGVSLGLPGWKIPYRTGKKQEKVEINFSGNGPEAWKLVLDGQFVAAWAGSSYLGEKRILIPEGEHEFKLICFSDAIKKSPEKLPFRLNLKFN